MKQKHQSPGTGCLHPLAATTPPPARFTWPFCYEPHPLCVAAAAAVQRYLASANEWTDEISRGKMFGVLVVEREDGGLAFLAAYSGLLGGRNDWPWFVPPVFDSQQPDGYFKTREAEISEINRLVAELENSETRRRAAATIDSLKHESDKEVAALKARIDKARKACGDEKIKQLQFLKAETRRVKKRFAAQIELAAAELQTYDSRIATMKQLRHSMSDDLQRWLFGQYAMLNARDESLPLTDIFKRSTGHIPPAGAGDCCAPKLLQHAYRNGLRPKCMAEFWWGESPRAEIRHHLHYYPACRGKCKPILEYMMQGLEVDPDPLATDNAADGMEILYDDKAIAVVYKPAGMLSVPGKGNLRSVLSLVRERYPEAEGPIIVHRLDMSTSGLLVVAKTTAAYHNLQAQFASHSVNKRYVALLSADLTNRPSHRHGSGEGRIDIPLRPDPLDRPRQVADYEHGKNAITEYRILETVEGLTRVELRPLTGRTHQLRVHCAHRDGLNAPIEGDNLYGRPADRLYLHAESIEFTHPDTGQRMAFERKADF